MGPVWLGAALFALGWKCLRVSCEGTGSCQWFSCFGLGPVLEVIVGPLSCAKDWPPLPCSEGLHLVIAGLGVCGNGLGFVGMIVPWDIVCA